MSWFSEKIGKPVEKFVKDVGQHASSWAPYAGAVAATVLVPGLGAAILGTAGAAGGAALSLGGSVVGMAANAAGGLASAAGSAVSGLANVAGSAVSATGGALKGVASLGSQVVSGTGSLAQEAVGTTVTGISKVTGSVLTKTTYAASEAAGGAGGILSWLVKSGSGILSTVGNILGVFTGKSTTAETGQTIGAAGTNQTLMYPYPVISETGAMGGGGGGTSVEVSIPQVAEGAKAGFTMSQSDMIKAGAMILGLYLLSQSKKKK